MPRRNTKTCKNQSLTIKPYIMNTDVKDLWVAALRSGTYTQTTGELQNAYGFCCMGVLCDLYFQKVGGNWTPSEDEEMIVFTDEDGNTNFGTCPDGVMEWSGLKEENPYVSGRHLSDWNDEEKISFDEIANLINENL